MSTFMIANDTLDLLASMPAYTAGHLYLPTERVNKSAIVTDSMAWWRTQNGEKFTIQDGQLIKSELIATNEIPVMIADPKMEGKYSYEPFRYIDPYSVDTSDLIGACLCYRYQVDGWNQYFALLYIRTVLDEILHKLSGDKWEYRRHSNPRRI